MIFPALGIRSSVLRADRSFFVSKRAKVRFTRFCSEPRESSVMSWGDGHGLGQLVYIVKILFGKIVAL